MTKIIGRLQNVGIGRENSRGNEVQPQYWLKPLDLNVDIKTEIVDDVQGLGRIEDADGAAIMKKYGEVTVRNKIHDQSLGLLLLAAFGSVSSADSGDASGNVYAHTFTVGNNNSHPSLTLTAKNPNEDVKYGLGMLELLNIDCTPDDYPSVEAQFMSKPHTAGSSTVAHIAERDFIMKHLTFKKASAQSGLDAAAAVQIRSFNLSIKKNLSMEFESKDGSNDAIEPAEILNQKFEVTGSVVLRYDGNTYEGLQNNETDQALRFQFLHPDTIGTSDNPEFLIDLYKARISNYSRDFAMDDLVEESFDFKAYYSISDSAMIRAVLTNLVTDYDADPS